MAFTVSRNGDGGARRGCGGTSSALPGRDGVPARESGEEGRIGDPIMVGMTALSGMVCCWGVPHLCTGDAARMLTGDCGRDCLSVAPGRAAAPQPAAGDEGCIGDPIMPHIDVCGSGGPTAPASCGEAARMGDPIIPGPAAARLAGLLCACCSGCVCFGEAWGAPDCQRCGLCVGLT